MTLRPMPDMVGGTGSAPTSLRLGRDPKHDVEPGGKLADLRALKRCEVDGYGVAFPALAEIAENAVPLVAGMAFDVALGCQQFLVALLDLVVNVRRTAGIGDRL